jgi:PTS system nitrogen regulatory IIA component
MTKEDHLPEKLMTLAEVAEYLQIKERTIYQWAQQGKIPGFKLGNIWRFKRDDIELWIEERKRDTPRKKEKKDKSSKSSEEDI